MTKDVVLPLSEPIRMRDGTMSNVVHLPKGTEIIPDVGAANCDTTLWGPDAHEWRPERWLEPLPTVLEDVRVPGVYANLCGSLGCGADRLFCMQGVVLHAGCRSQVRSMDACE